MGEGRGDEGGGCGVEETGGGEGVGPWEGGCGGWECGDEVGVGEVEGDIAREALAAEWLEAT